MIRFDNVTKCYPNGKEGLSNINFSLESGEMAFLTGHSGAGKSTLLSLIALLERPTKGQIWVNGLNLNKLSDQSIASHRRQVGMIFQDHKLLPDRTIFDNVVIPLIISGKGHHEVKRRGRAALDKVGLLKKEKSLPISLSGGEQQRVGIARALISKPPLILADEPTGNLDPELSREIMNLFMQFNQVGVSVLIASHNIDLIRSLKKRIISLKNGSIVSDEIYNAKDHNEI
tara:strand:+ start:16756 stop:17445 length:690 start_codon:yes stop_codon:yes gene_type:complete